MKKIEEEIESQRKIPTSDALIFFRPCETEQEKELKLKKKIEELKQKYGDVSEEDVLICEGVYVDKPFRED